MVILTSAMPDVLTYLCPFCDSKVRVGSPCPGCAKKVRKKERTKTHAWSQPSSQDGLDLPDDDFDYEAFIAREFGKAPHRSSGIKWYWWWLAVALVIGMATGLIWFR